MKRVLFFCGLICFIHTNGSSQEADSTLGRKYYKEAIDSSRTNLDEMAKKFKLASQYLQTEGPWEEYITSFNGLYFYYKMVNFQYDSAKKYANLAYVQAKEKLKPDTDVFATAMNNMGVWYTQLGAYSKAKEHFLYLLENEVYDKSAAQQNLAKLYINLASNHKRLGDYQEATRYYQQAIVLLDTLGPEALQDQANSYAQIGRIQKELNQFEMANKNFTNAINILSPKNKSHHKKLIDYYQTLADISEKRNKVDDILKYLKTAYKLQKESPHLLHGNSRILAKYYLKNEDYDQALSFQEKYTHSLDSIFKNNDRLPPKIRSIQEEGEIHQHFAQYEKALERYQYGISLLSKGVEPTNFGQNPKLYESISSFDLIPLLRLKAQALKNWAQETKNEAHLKLALETYELVMKMVSEVRSKYRSSESQSIISAFNKGSIEEALAVNYQLYQKDQIPAHLDYALHFLEQNKAARLQSSLQELEARSSLGLPDSLQVKEITISNELADIRTMLYREENQGIGRPEVIASFKQDLFQLEEQQRSLIQQLEWEYPEYHQMKYEQKNAQISDIQQKLKKGEVVIEYFWGKEHIYILGISQEKTFMTRISQSQEIKNTFAIFHHLLKDGELALKKGFDPVYYKDFTSQAYQLYTWLMEPTMDSFADTKKLILIPDGLLNYLPFEVLLSEAPIESPNVNYAGLPYLVKDFAINYQYSAAIFIQRDLINEKEEEHIILSVAPEYKNGKTYSIDIEKLLSSNDTREGVNPLVYNQEEVSFISKIWDGLALLGKEATETAFKSLSPKAKILHLAMHAFSDDNDPMHSGLIFNSADTDDTNDGILHAHEIYNMDLSAELVILSACNTGAGQLSEGEGVMSLARSFAYAGCPSTAMSLWRANDETISQIMQSFHKYLNEGMQKSTAMRQAKLDFLESSDRTHPYFWAAFMTTGDDSPITRQGFPMWAYLLIGIFLLGLIFWWRSQKN